MALFVFVSFFLGISNMYVLYPAVECYNMYWIFFSPETVEFSVFFVLVVGFFPPFFWGRSLVFYPAVALYFVLNIFLGIFGQIGFEVRDGVCRSGHGVCLIVYKVYTRGYLGMKPGYLGHTRVGTQVPPEHTSIPY